MPDGDPIADRVINSESEDVSHGFAAGGAEDDVFADEGVPSIPRLSATRGGRRLVKPGVGGDSKINVSPQQRLLILDTWRRSGLPAGDFAELVNVSKHTLDAWKKRFEEQGPAGLMDQPRGANARMTILDDDEDFAAFEKVLAHAVERSEMRLLAYCLMPNHWHLVVWPHQDGELSEFAGWLTLTHTQRWHAHRHSKGSGHVYQGRFKSFPIQDDGHLYTVARYVERNALRAGLAAGPSNGAGAVFIAGRALRPKTRNCWPPGR